jgi:protein O-GlcNAc transferase
MKFSVIVPLYKRTTYLKPCLGSILTQDPGPEGGEVLLWDDGSPDTFPPGIIKMQDDGSSCGLLPVIQETIQKVAPNGTPWNIVYRHQPENTGMFQNFNDALETAQGDWIHILCEDDYVTPEFYRVMGDVAAQQPPTVGAVCCGFANLFEPQKIMERHVWEASGVLEGFYERLKMNNPLQVPSVIMRREALREVGPFRTDFPYVGDWELWLRLAKRHQWFYVPHAMAIFRVHQESQSATLARDGKQAEDIARLKELLAHN